METEVEGEKDFLFQIFESYSKRVHEYEPYDHNHYTLFRTVSDFKPFSELFQKLETTLQFDLLNSINLNFLTDNFIQSLIIFFQHCKVDLLNFCKVGVDEEISEISKCYS
jgi:hypothetical protein